MSSAMNKLNTISFVIAYLKLPLLGREPKEFHRRFFSRRRNLAPCRFFDRFSRYAFSEKLWTYGTGSWFNLQTLRHENKQMESGFQWLVQEAQSSSWMCIEFFWYTTHAMDGIMYYLKMKRLRYSKRTFCNGQRQFNTLYSMMKFVCQRRRIRKKKYLPWMSSKKRYFSTIFSMLSNINNWTSESDRFYDFTHLC